ncbi:clustered mitochondria protein-like isoform X2 [Andrographis paniculata]|uniref:clustered mitochondria protein-like isoform X2 n=1 Tax=Andrographis paniculata TaxID=175694 RepID=UPI0021E8F9C0|nr:clustered mitochondria protein-like isoform X2 [Andrographis paniculata]
MAGKSGKGRSRRGSQQSAVNSTEQPVSSAATLNNGTSNAQENGDVSLNDSNGAKPEVNDQNNATDQVLTKQAGIHLYPVSVKTQGGEKLELQLSPVDSVLDVRQFLLEAPETCYFTCYDLLLHAKDGIHHLEDYNEISEVADITSGSCLLEMVSAIYDDRSIRAHVHRTRELLSLSTLHSSLSTLLALQHETAKNASSRLGDTAKPDMAELESLGFMENIAGSLSNLLSSPSKDIKCVEYIVFSSFNPPPSHRRLSGDLLYLDVATLEGNKYCTTGTTKGFYVNSSTGNVLDPKPHKSSFEATTLVGLLQKISPKFKKAFREILESKASAHPFENVQCLLLPNTWLGLYPVPDHKRDASRAENALTLSFGSELIGMQRDWNEELQSCREFPHASQQERILRDRALHKVTSDFVDAAMSGALGVINRCIPPINPTDPECFHMYVHNNIFFSFAVDSDLEQLSRKQGSEENSKVQTKVSTQNNSEKLENGQEQGNHRVPDGDESAVPNTDNINAIEARSPDMPAESQLSESEQATYASANNDLKGTKAYQEADVPGLYNLAMAIIDYRGHRVVAQSVLPGILQGDKSDSLLYGSVDNGKKICWSEDFHSKLLEAAKRLHLKEHTVLDGSGNAVVLAAPVECKGIVGSDDRHYLLDLMRATPRDANYTGPGSRFCILRPELISSFCHAEAGKGSEKASHLKLVHPVSDSLNPSSTEEVVKPEDNAASATSETQDEKQKLQDLSHSRSEDESKEILFNPNVFTEFKLAGDPEEIASDEENVQKASLYLKDVVLPKFIQDLCILEVSPMDGQTLTEALHAHGINVRYIGKIADGIKHMPHLWDLCTNEIVVRSVKHIVKDILRDAEDHDLAHAVSHFFNSLLGKVHSVSSKGVGNISHSKSQKKAHSGSHSPGKPSKGQAKSPIGGYTKKKQSLYLNITSDSLWADIQEFAKLKYQFELPEDSRQRVKKISVVRNLCQKVGITIAARKYDFDASSPFQASDILNIQPVVKHAIPVCSEAKDLIETGKIQLAEGDLPEAFTLFSQAFTLLQQVTGPMHREVANCCRYLAMVAYHAGDMAGAIIQQHKELIINERCLGLDHPDTAHSYGNMALFYHGLKQTELALRHMSRALLLLGLSSGTDHPDVAATFINVAMMYHDFGKVDTSLRYLQEALKKNEKLLGEDHIQTAVCYHALAIVFNSMGAFKLSYQHEKKTYDILVKQLGEEDARTKEAQNWMKAFKMRELQANAQKQKGENPNSVSAQKAIDILKAHPDLIQAFQAAAVSGGTGSSANKLMNNAVLGEGLPRSHGRGVDERAARAAAEVRKKAAAKGLTIRPQGVPVPSPPPLTQLINIMSAGDAANNNEVIDKGVEESANGYAPTNAVEDLEKEYINQTPPAGLGLGLASLDGKKRKTKAKGSSS